MTYTYEQLYEAHREIHIRLHRAVSHFYDVLKEQQIDFYDVGHKLKWRPEGEIVRMQEDGILVRETFRLQDKFFVPKEALDPETGKQYIEQLVLDDKRRREEANIRYMEEKIQANEAEIAKFNRKLKGIKE
jgi:hypothetical protein